MNYIIHHINGKMSDNRIENLRIVNIKENMYKENNNEYYKGLAEGLRNAMEYIRTIPASKEIRHNVLISELYDKLQTELKVAENKSFERSNLCTKLKTD